MALVLDSRFYNQCTKLLLSVLTFQLRAWCGHLTCTYKKKLPRIVTMAGKITGKPQNPLDPMLYREDEEESKEYLSR